MRNKKILSAAILGMAAVTAQAFQIISLSPQGEVARVRQVVVKFDESAVNFGDPKAAAPLTLSCSDAQVTKGTGRWVNDRVWAFDFDNDLPPGISCSVQAKPGYKSPKGAELAGVTSYKFNSGGPFVQGIQPYQGQRIDEEPTVLAPRLRLHRAAKMAFSAAAASSCSAKASTSATASTTTSSVSTGPRLSSTAVVNRDVSRALQMIATSIESNL